MSRKEIAKSTVPAWPAREAEPDWTFLTNHAHVLLCIVREPEILVRDVARLVGITERSVQRLVVDLENAGYIKRIHRGRRNYYEVQSHLPPRHSIGKHQRVSTRITLVQGKQERGQGRPRR